MLLTMVARPDAFIYPPRAKNVLPRHDTEMLADLGWIAQYKFNDSHLLLKLRPEGVELWGRKGERLAYQPSPDMVRQVRDVQDLLGLDRDQYHLLDGGLLDSRHSAIKDTIVLWDVLVRNGEHLLGTTYRERYLSLYGPVCERPCGQYVMPGGEGHAVGVRATEDIFVPHSWPHVGTTTDPASAREMWEQMWRHVELVNRPYPQPLLEGIMYKDAEGVLDAGFREANNGHFMVRSRVTTRRHQF